MPGADEPTSGRDWNHKMMATTPTEPLADLIIDFQVGDAAGGQLPGHGADGFDRRAGRLLQPPGPRLASFVPSRLHPLAIERSRQRLRAHRDRILTPAVVYGYYPANGDGDDLIVWEPDAPLERELVRFTFPRQHRGRFLCISDFFRPLDSGEVDVLGVHVVTMGHRISEVAHQLFAEDRYQDYLFAHGFGVEMAEALAELWHRRIREELGITGDDGPTVQDWFRQGYRGSRYSFGYPACPDLEDQEKLFRLVDPGQIAVELTDEYMLHPEQSTSAIIVHHPEAKYFNAR